MTSSRSVRLGLIYLVAGSALAGIQAILPALPAIQAHFGLSDSEVGLVISAFLLPSVFLTLPMGMLADRMGRRPVLSGSLAVFGLVGVLLSLGPATFSLLLGARIIQGAAFAAILPLTITMIGDARSGAVQVASQGRRSVSMFAAEAMFPLLGGALVAISWAAPFALQALTLPLAVACWFTIPSIEGSHASPNRALWRLAEFIRQPPVLALEALTFSRFFVKFAFLTYLPILLVSRRGMTESFVGLVLGVFAMSGMVAALVTGRLALRMAAFRWIRVSLVSLGAALVLLSVDSGPVGAISLALVFGFADGLFGVFLNALTAGVVGVEMRASFVGASGTIRNAGKFLAPSVVALLILAVPLEAAFALVGVSAFVALTLVPFLRRLDWVGSPDRPAMEQPAAGLA